MVGGVVMGVWELSEENGVVQLVLDLKDEKINKLTPENMREWDDGIWF